ncbi:MAG: M15 family metallopeptidase, partial [Lachnospiraceae bacterium]|nr:M15 family metallopeptidase [Lachnospiraceae bacterium]
EDWQLVLVNKWNKMEEGYVPELKELADGHMIDARIADALMEMIRGAKKAGHTIYILSAYRSMEKQISLYEAEVAEWLEAGYSEVKAEEKAGTVVAVPGTSEHQLGLAVDLVSSKHVKLDEDAEKTEGYKWLVNNCHKYGFILRYPNGATDITGIIYEPWHFRYVGEDAAEAIMEAGITLEEYLER